MSIRRLFRILLLLFLLPVWLYLMQFNCRLYHRPVFQEKDGVTVNVTLLKQLRFLRAALEQGADKQMQNIYPEGFLFIRCLYGLAWCNAVKSQPPGSALYREGMREIDGALRRVQSEEAKAIFDRDVSLEYGAFYQGWTNYLLGQKLALQPSAGRDAAEVHAFQSNCRKIAAAYEAASTPYLASYALGTWPADNMLCMATLALHDRLFAPAFQALIRRWLERVRQSLDPATGLIPHEVQPNGAAAGGARGSSQSLMLILLADIDPVFAAEQFALYLKYFSDKRFSLTGIREYPKGFTGGGDIDSGPVICDMGGAASIVGIGAAMRLERPDLGIQIRNAVEGISFPLEGDESRRYFWGMVPMADAFLAWANSFAAAPDPPEQANWRWAFHGWSLLLALVLLAFYRLLIGLAR